VTTPAREEEWTALMRAGMAGDATAYRRFLVSATPYLRAIAQSRLRDFRAVDTELEDIVQEVLLAVHLKRGTWDQSRPISPWLAAIVRNKLIDALRRRGRYASVPLEDVMDILPAQDQLDGQISRDIDTLLERLNSRQRDIVRSISMKGCSVRETASRLQMTEGAVRVALHRALKALATLYWSDNV
jgi:RNA polymerase sigma factor (sigma-70 family)